MCERDRERQREYLCTHMEMGMGRWMVEWKLAHTCDREKF